MLVRCRLTLGWSLGDLARLSDINKGTLQHVEKGDVHLPAAKRQKVIDVLIEALQQAGQSANRQEFLILAGLPTAPIAPIAPTAPTAPIAPTVLSIVSSTPQLPGI